MNNIGKELLKALALVDEEIDKAGLTKETDGYNYKYLPLPDLLKVARPIFRKHGIRLRTHKQAHENGKDILFVRLQHIETGQYCESSCWLGDDWEDYKGWGGEDTYKRRYLLMGELGISPEDDKSEKSSYQKKQYNNTQNNSSNKKITDPQLKYLETLLQNKKQYAMELLKEYGSFQDIPRSEASKIIEKAREWVKQSTENLKEIKNE